MLPKIILLVSCLYIVQATFVINAPDDSSVENDNKPLAEGDADLSDDFKIEVSEDNSDAASTLATVCTNPACHNFCRSRGYAWGVCIGAYVCRCYRYGLAFNENKDGAENAVEINKDEDNDDVKELNDGDVNFTVDFESDEVPSEDTSEAAAALAARACNNSNCNRFCRARGYARGRCVSSRVCRCYRYKTTLWDGEDEAESEKKTNPKADMAKSTFNGQQAPQENLGAVNKLASARACNARICNRNCRALRYDRGICIISRCQCLGRPIRIAFANVLENAINENGLAETENDAENEVETNDIADSVPSSFDGDLDEPEENLNTASRSVNVVSPTPGCDPVACGKICRGLGYTYGTCFLRRCQCHRNGRVRSAFSNVADNDINDNSIPEADIYNTEPVLSDPLLSQEAVPAPRASNCVLRWCEQTCRRMGFSGGACVNGRCKCDILRSALPWPIPAPRKDVIMSLKGKCVDYQCTEICRRMRYRGGLCTADSCICFM